MEPTDIKKEMEAYRHNNTCEKYFTPKGRAARKYHGATACFFGGCKLYSEKSVNGWNCMRLIAEKAVDRVIEVEETCKERKFEVSILGNAVVTAKTIEAVIEDNIGGDIDVTEV